MALRIYAGITSLLLAFSAPCLLGAQQPAQDSTLALRRARALYYTPVDGGLESFHCDVSFHWKEFIQKASNQAVADDDMRLRYLQTIQLSMDDKLRGGGELHWSAPTPAPDDAEDSVNKIRDGLEQIWSGFFQSWNGFMTGDLITLDSLSTVDRTASGYHVAVRTAGSLAEEQYDSSLLLRSVHVATPSLDSTIQPVFQQTPQGLLVSAMNSSYRQPPSSPPTTLSMNVTYTPVQGIQLPATLTVQAGPATFAFQLSNCTVQTTLTSK